MRSNEKKVSCDPLERSRKAIVGFSGFAALPRTFFPPLVFNASETVVEQSAERDRSKQRSS